MEYLRNNHLVRLLAISFIGILMTDCKKKDPEEEDPPLQLLENKFCEDACIFANDGDCDDGGYDADSDFCSFGTDCSDCGERVVYEVVD